MHDTKDEPQKVINYLSTRNFVLLSNLLDDWVIKETGIIILLHRAIGSTKRRVCLKYYACNITNKPAERSSTASIVIKSVLYVNLIISLV